MNLSVNQNRQFYAINTVGASTTKYAGQFEIAGAASSNANEDSFYFISNGEGGVTRSDLIKKSNIISVRATVATEKLMKKVTITMPTPTVGEDYVLNIVHNNFIAMGDENTYIKFGVVHATASITTVANLAAEMAKSINKNYYRESRCSVYAIASTTTLTLYVPIDTDAYIQGVFPEVVPSITVSADWLNDSSIVYGEESNAPFTLSMSGNTAWTATKGNAVPVYNNADIKDMEYFCLGDRGDMYRNVGWPYVMNTRYATNSIAATYGWCVLDIHYYYTGDNESVQKSEKTLTVVVPASAAYDATASSNAGNGTTAFAKLNSLIGSFNTASGKNMSTFSNAVTATSIGL